MSTPLLLLLWGAAFVWAPRGSLRRLVAGFALFWMLLSGCTRHGYSYQEANRVERQTEHRRAWYQRRRHRLQRQERRQLRRSHRAPLLVAGWQVPLVLAAGEQPALVYVFDVRGRPLWEGPATEAPYAQLPPARTILVGVTSDAGQWQIKKISK